MLIIRTVETSCGIHMFAELLKSQDFKSGVYPRNHLVQISYTMNKENMSKMY